MPTTPTRWSPGSCESWSCTKTTQRDGCTGEKARRTLCWLITAPDLHLYVSRSLYDRPRLLLRPLLLLLVVGPCFLPILWRCKRVSEEDNYLGDFNGRIRGATRWKHFHVAAAKLSSFFWNGLDCDVDNNRLAEFCASAKSVVMTQNQNLLLLLRWLKNLYCQRMSKSFGESGQLWQMQPHLQPWHTYMQVQLFSPC